MPHRRHFWRLLVHSAAARLVDFQHIQHRGDWPRCCAEHLLRRARPNRGRLDLQGWREEQGVPYWPLGERRITLVCGRWGPWIASLLQAAEPARSEGWRGSGLRLLRADPEDGEEPKGFAARYHPTASHEISASLRVLRLGLRNLGIAL